MKTAVVLNEMVNNHLSTTYGKNHESTLSKLCALDGQKPSFHQFSQRINFKDLLQVL